MKVDSMDAAVNQVLHVKPVANVQKEEDSNFTATNDAGKQISDNTDTVELINKPATDPSAVAVAMDRDRGEFSISEKALIDAIEKANKAAMGRTTAFKFSIHEGTKRISVQVMDSETNEVIREIPPEKILDMVAKMWDFAGLFIDERR